MISSNERWCSDKEGGRTANYKIVDIFKAMFPMRHISNIVAWTSRNLELLNKPLTTETEILRFFAILILETRFQFNIRRILVNLTLIKV